MRKLKRKVGGEGESEGAQHMGKGAKAPRTGQK